MPRGIISSWVGRKSAKMKAIPESSPPGSLWSKASWDSGSPNWTEDCSPSISLHRQDSGRGPYGRSLGEWGRSDRSMDLNIEKYDPLAPHLIDRLEPESAHQPGPGRTDSDLEVSALGRELQGSPAATPSIIRADTRRSLAAETLDPSEEYRPTPPPRRPSLRRSSVNDSLQSARLKSSKQTSGQSRCKRMLTSAWSKVHGTCTKSVFQRWRKPKEPEAFDPRSDRYQREGSLDEYSIMSTSSIACNSPYRSEVYSPMLQPVSTVLSQDPTSGHDYLEDMREWESRKACDYEASSPTPADSLRTMISQLKTDIAKLEDNKSSVQEIRNDISNWRARSRAESDGAKVDESCETWSQDTIGALLQADDT